MKKLCLSEYTTVDEVIENIVAKPYLVPENMKADALLRNMKKTRNYFAVVIDEYGGTRGVITLQDLLEILVGDINEPDDEVREEIRKVSENEWQIMGSAPIDKVKEMLSVQFENEECETFAGYILGIYGTIPDDGTEFDIETDLLHIHVEHVEEHRIIFTMVSKKEPEQELS